MNLHNFEQHIDEIILGRGLDYYKGGAVLEAEEVEKGIWQAEVEGSGMYSVEVGISGKNKIDTFFCDYPYEGPICKHVVALLYTIRETVKIPLKEEEKSKKLSFSELLGKATLKELREFVNTYAENDKQFRTRFELNFAHKDGCVDIREKYTKLIKSAIRSHSSGGFIEYRASHGLSRELDAALAKAQALADSANFRDSMVIAQVVVKLAATEVIPNCDDSSGTIGDTIYSGINQLEAIAYSDRCSIELKEELFRFLNSELTNNTYFGYGDFGYNLFEIYRYVCGLLSKQTEFLAFTDRLKTPRPESWHDSYTYAFFVQQKILFYQETGQEKEADSLARQNMSIVEIRRSFVDKAIRAKDYPAAKQLITEGIHLAEQRKHPGTVSEWEKVLLRIAGLEGDLGTLRQIALKFAFDRGFQAEYYRQWKATFPEADWEREYSDLIRLTIENVKKEAVKMSKNQWWSEAYQHLLRLGPVYLEEKQWAPLLALLKAYPDLHALLQYLPELATEFPEEMTTLLIPALSRSADQTSDRSGYANLVRTMKQVMKAIPGSRKSIIELAQQLKAKYPRRPAMIDELGKLK